MPKLGEAVRLVNQQDQTMNPNIREATASDATWFVDHVRALVSEPDAQIPLRPDEFVLTSDQQAELFSGADKRGDLFLIAEADGVRVGELNLRRGTRAAFKHAATLGMSVAREWRNQRIGSALMQRSLEWARDQSDLRRIELYVYASNRAAIRLYERHGFVIEGRRRGAIRVGDEYVDDLLMACEVRLDV